MRKYRGAIAFGALALLLLFSFYALQDQARRSAIPEISYSELVNRVEAGDVASITISGESAVGNLRDGSSFTTTLLPYYDQNILRQMQERGVRIDARATQSEAPLATFLIYWLPFLALIGVWTYLVRKMTRGFERLDRKLAQNAPPKLAEQTANSTRSEPPLTLRIKRLANAGGLPLPSYQSSNAAGLDICAAESAEIGSGKSAIVSTGFAISLPSGCEAQVRPRSGLAAKHGVTVLNSPGTIDADYRGEIKVILVNLGSETVHIARGDRIAQLVVAPVSRVSLVEVEELDETARGAAGFGSSGRR